MMYHTAKLFSDMGKNVLIDGVLFDKNQTALIQYPTGKQGAYTIPNRVKSIGDEAFYGCDELVDVYCYATTPPVTKGEDTFSCYNAFLYVPCESKKAYMVDAVWGNFKYIECISSEGIEDISSSSLQGGDRGRLILRDGQVLILRNGKTYTMQGQEVK